MSDLFTINYKPEEINNIKNKIKEFNWSKVSLSKTWEMGTNPKKLAELCEYWINEYDWAKDQNYLNSFNQYKSNVDNLNLHYIHEKGKGKTNYPWGNELPNISVCNIDYLNGGILPVNHYDEVDEFPVKQ